VDAVVYVALRIGAEEKEWSGVTETWIRDQLGRRRADGQNVCLQLIVRGGEINLMFSSPGCGGGGGGGRPLKPAESRILEIWNEMHLNTADFSSGNVFAMLRRVHQVVG